MGERQPWQVVSDPGACAAKDPRPVRRLSAAAASTTTPLIWLWCARLFAFGNVLLGVALLVGGVAVHKSAAGSSPEEAFAAFDGHCMISGVNASRNTRDGKCFDEYVYTFCLPHELGGRRLEAGGTACGHWRSKRHSIGLCDGDCASCDEGSEPEFELGMFVDCWYGKSRKVTQRLSTEALGAGQYECGNDPCYKIFDPADETTARNALGTVLIVVGMILVHLFGFCCFLTFHAQPRRRGKKQISPRATSPLPAAMCVPDKVDVDIECPNRE